MGGVETLRGCLMAPFPIHLAPLRGSRLYIVHENLFTIYVPAVLFKYCTAANVGRYPRPCIVFGRISCRHPLGIQAVECKPWRNLHVWNALSTVSADSVHNTPSKIVMEKYGNHKCRFRKCFPGCTDLNSRTYDVTRFLCMMIST